MTDLVPVVLSGGSGTRLWPLSRSLYPKQLQILAGDETMLQGTLRRVQGAPFTSPIVICNHEHRFVVAEQAREKQLPVGDIVLEPVGRNTAPAAAVAALIARDRHGDAPVVLMPSDHVVNDRTAFLDAVGKAADAARNGHLATFGITPNRPETGYGYIRCGKQLAAIAGAQTVAAFTEKPDAATAERYLSEGDYLWNSGIFVFRPSDMLGELARLHPDLLAAAEKSVATAKRDMDFLRLDEDAFTAIDGVSIDYAVMEHTDHAAVVPVDMGWSDVGSWHALWEIGEKDAGGNVTGGDVLISETKNSLVRTTGPLVVALGVEDLAVVATPDAFLVTDRNKAAMLGDVVKQLAAAGHPAASMPQRVYRPWGYYQSIDSGDRFQVKHISVNPGSSLSLQRHAKRAEHWVVVNGIADVVCGEERRTMRENESIYIPVGMVHRLANPGDTPLRLIEVQTGGYLGEDDIERLEDIYGRE
jgi:mannose-1-phosphate guanylyltransferase/mannose-6-phosphate isomerase